MTAGVGTTPMDGPMRDADAGVPATARRSNVRTALVLLSIAAIFFVGVVVDRWLFGR